MFRPIINKNLIVDGNSFVAPNIGFQRTIGKRISLDQKIGYAFLFKLNGETAGTIFLNFSLSYVFFSKKST
jgi:hypothetical protein